jgi:drug/metabolite transporter (DMT)-like permease
MTASLSRKDLALLALLTLLWGVNWPVMKAGVQDFAPLSFRTLCMVGGVVWLGLLVRWRGDTMPVWTAVVGWLLYGDRIGPRLAWGVAAAAAAVALLLAGELGAIAGRPAGALPMLAAAATWGWGTHLMRRRRLPGSILVLTFWMMVMAALTCGAIAWWLERDQWVRPPDAVEWGAIAYNVFLVFGLSQLLWFRLASILPPVASSLSVMLIPVVGLFAGMLLLGERPTWHDWAALGCVLVAIGTVLLPKRADPAPARARDAAP